MNEVAIRPLDAYGALKYLRTRAEIADARAGADRFFAEHLGASQ